MQGDAPLRPGLKTLSLRADLNSGNWTHAQPLQLAVPASLSEAYPQGVAMGTGRPYLSPGRRRLQPRSPRVSAANSSSEAVATAEATEAVEGAAAASTAVAAKAAKASETAKTSEVVFLQTSGPMPARTSIFPGHIVVSEHCTAWHLGLGRCTFAFWLAVSFDLVGLAVLITGVFSEVFFYDLLLYAGSIIIFLSLIWWVFWYTGNVEAPPDHSLLPSKRLQLRSSSYLQTLRESISQRLTLSRQGKTKRTKNKFPLQLSMKTINISRPGTLQRGNPKDPQSERPRLKNSPLENFHPEISSPETLQSESSQKVVNQKTLN
ncbi:uncharacterized protein LOC127538946 [Antechinus flavipes]|uniref:uncharacterized protein LOC127538946 n=1 Tax=Antechinus flavipes TaxID=38775 RepID=UPI0022359A17|nr:uncharacterized protein LOC127538946 [Antechinus flavipes]XP_051818795.1 uncharacterized protein LOC127538946 [Antechinus flavipes]